MQLRFNQAHKTSNIDS